MKKLSFWLSFLIYATAVVFLVGCGGTSGETKSADGYVTVAFVDPNGNIEGKNRFSVKKGEDLRVDLRIKEGYSISEFSASEDCEMIGSAETVTIFLSSVRYDRRIVLNTVESSILHYELNGGSFYAGDLGRDSYAESGNTPYHLRKNTSYGTDLFYRDGYVLTGWNTRADGSGEHVGLGSRVTVGENETKALYAEWAAWSDPSLFTYADNRVSAQEGDIVITGYTGGDTELLVIPEEIDGYPVTRCAENMARGVAIDTLVFHKNMDMLDRKAFSDCRIREVFLYDNIRRLEDDSLGRGVITLHLNVVMAPRYSYRNDNSQFAEDMDRLIVNADKKKMVFWAGCSMSYGLRSEMVEEAFDGEYVVCNFGVNGDTNATFQIDCITAYLGADDVFIHAPEVMSTFQTMNDVSSNWMLYSCVESNFDLLALADASAIEGLLKGLESFNTSRRSIEEKDYDFVNPHYNSYGDYVTERPDNADDTNFNADAPYVCFPAEYVNEVSAARLNHYYGRLAEKGVTVFFSYGPINENALSEAERRTQSWNVFARAINSFLDKRFVTVISSPASCIFAGKYFYDTDYHLTNNGAAERTQRLVRDIKSYL